MKNTYVLLLLLCFAANIYAQTPESLEPPQNLNIVFTDDNSYKLTWQPSPSPEVKFYVIVHKKINQETAQIVDSVASDILSYKAVFNYANSTLCDNKVEFYVKATNGYGIESPLKLMKTQFRNIPIVTKVDDTTNCNRSILIQFSSYNYVPFGQLKLKYKFMKSTDNGNFIFMYEPGTQGDNTGTYGLTDNRIVSGKKYIYRMEIWNKEADTLITTSCSHEFNPFFIDPKYSVNNSVSTKIDNSGVDLNFKTDAHTPEHVMSIIRTDDNNLTEIIYNKGSIRDNYFDNKANVSERWYKYKYVIYDKCNTVLKTSEELTTIHLKKTIENNNVILNWTESMGWFDRDEAGSNTKEIKPDKYNIYRSIDNGAFEIVGAVAYGNILTYKDDISKIGDSKIIYYIEAVNAIANSTIYYKSSSNSVNHKVDDETSIPNAFTPGKEPNNIFKPVFSNIEIVSFNMLIYNRIGGLVFSTNDAQKGWNGNNENGKPASAGGYVYIINYSTPNGKNTQYKGNILLIR